MKKKVNSRTKKSSLDWYLIFIAVVIGLVAVNEGFQLINFGYVGIQIQFMVIISLFLRAIYLHFYQLNDGKKYIFKYSLVLGIFSGLIPILYLYTDVSFDPELVIHALFMILVSLIIIAYSLLWRTKQ
jgi:hypothetical protein